MKTKKKRVPVLVTGGAGFIGSHVVDELVNEGYEVVVLDDLSGGFKANVNSSAVFIRGSVCNETLVEGLFQKYKFTYVFHLAAYAAEGLSHFIRLFNYSNNVLGSMTLINASVKYGVKCFVFTSSIAVYGKNQLPMREDLAPMPEDPYGVAKYAVELDLKAAHEMFGLPFIIFRPHNVYGERQNLGDKYRNVLGIFLNKLMLKEPLPIFGDGLQQRAFTYIGDVAPLIAKSVKIKAAYNEVFNVGSDTPYTINELAMIVASAAKLPLKVKHYPARNEVKFAYSEHQKVETVFGKQSSTSLKDGVEKMAAWALTQGPRTGKPFKRIEVTQNLPPAWKIKK